MLWIDRSSKLDLMRAEMRLRDQCCKCKCGSSPSFASVCATAVGSRCDGNTLRHRLFEAAAYYSPLLRLPSTSTLTVLYRWLLQASKRSSQQQLAAEGGLELLTANYTSRRWCLFAERPLLLMSHLCCVCLFKRVSLSRQRYAQQRRHP
jgi:hypothetical protein